MTLKQMFFYRMYLGFITLGRPQQQRSKQRKKTFLEVCVVCSKLQQRWQVQQRKFCICKLFREQHFSFKRGSKLSTPYAQNRIQTALQMFSPQELQELPMSYCQPCKMVVILTRISLFPIKVFCSTLQVFPIKTMESYCFPLQFPVTTYKHLQCMYLSFRALHS